jgi:hypothetical protein
MARRGAWAASVLFGSCLATAASADVQLTERGPVAFLKSELIRPGDAETLREFLDRPRTEPLRIIYLDSRGGRTVVALRMAKMIHDHGLDTAFHVGRAHCASECTTLFVGGIHRYYIDGSSVHDGIGTRYGLGFHPSSGGPADEDPVNAFYEEAGVSGAAQLRYHLIPATQFIRVCKVGKCSSPAVAPLPRQASLPAFPSLPTRDFGISSLP